MKDSSGSFQSSAPEAIKSWMKRVLQAMFGINAVDGNHVDGNHQPTHAPLTRRRLTLHFNPESINLDNKSTQNFTPRPTALAFDPIQSRMIDGNRNRPMEPIAAFSNDARREAHQGAGRYTSWNAPLHAREGTTQPVQRVSLS